MNLFQVQHAFPVDLARRLEALKRETGDSILLELAQVFRDMLGGALGESEARRAKGARHVSKVELEEFRDRLSTRLMESYRMTSSSSAFGLLYELNSKLFLSVISSRLRKFYFSLDPQDILQEVFFNIYRYPHKFKAEKRHAFRNWASMIIRNTVYKSTKDKDREITHEMQDAEIDGRADCARLTPLADAIREESRVFCSRTWVLILRLYLAAYLELSEREMKALRMVEIDGHAYKVAAAALGIRLENLKMVIFRARKKILRRLDRSMAANETLKTCLRDPPTVAPSRGGAPSRGARRDRPLHDEARRRALSPTDPRAATTPRVSSPAGTYTPLELDASDVSSSQNSC